MWNSYWLGFCIMIIFCNTNWFPFRGKWFKNGCNQTTRGISLCWCTCCAFLMLLYSGSLQQLNADEINEEVGNMWRTMYKLSKSFPDVPVPRRMAESMKFKLDKFKHHLPVLSIVCNRGMKERHWKQVL